MISRRWPMFPVLLAVMLLPGLTAGVALAQTGDVTFQVNMKIQMLEGKFKPGETDIVRVAGSFNAWGSSTDTLKDADGDSIYTKTVTAIPVGDIQYKFLKTLRAGSDWESGPNRTYAVVAGAQTLPVVYFDNDSVYTPPTADVPVTFQVNMRVKMLEGGFRPDLGDIVSVPGGFNGWNTAADTLRDADNDSIYTKTLTLSEGATFRYKFYKTPRAGSDWESRPDREMTVPVGGGVLPVVYFDDDTLVSLPVTANILWQVDMNAYIQLGWFRPDLGDTMQVRGPFNGWGPGSVLGENPFSPGSYELLLQYDGFTFDEIPHKFFIDFDSVSAVARFPLYSAATRDGHSYEHPAERGDGNRLFNVQMGGNISTPSFYYSSINPGGIIQSGDTVTVTMRVNMGPATRYVDPFVPGTDTVRLMWFDDLVRSAQTRIQGSFPNITMSPVGGPTDTIYQGTFRYVGPTHYNVLYYYRYIHPGAGSVDEGGGLGVQNPYRSRFIQPNAPNTFPRNYTAPLDVWQKNPPMPAETPPFRITDVYDRNIGQPTAYKLLQNFPNPFNPVTRIRYSIPERANVTLKVFNVLGQEVATLVREEQPAGNYVALFEAHRFASGVYFYRLEAGPFREVKKMLLLK